MRNMHRNITSSEFRESYVSKDDPKPPYEVKVVVRTNDPIALLVALSAFCADDGPTDTAP